jgi:hypothetical protein
VLEIKDNANLSGEREWEITVDGRLHPCCYYANDWSEKRLSDPQLKKEYEDNPDWNNLLKHSIDEIIQHPLYDIYIHHSGWNSDSPPPICVRECSVTVSDITGQERSKSKIDTFNTQSKNEL